ncbi:MAG: chloride channel protein, partial [Terriglobales bacterium]
IEVSGSYTVILPLLIANSIAFFISRNFQRQPIFEMLTHQDGMDLPSMEERREEEVLHVEDAMQPSSAPVMQWSDRVEAALTAAGDHAFLLVYGSGARWSGIATARLASLVAQGLGQHRLGEILAGSRLPALHPDEPLEMFLREAGDAPILPVVHRADNRLLGTVSLAGVLATYRHADQPAPEASPSAGTVAP